jgi:hypothetical protein
MLVGWAVSRWWGYGTGCSGSSCRSSGMTADAGMSLDQMGRKVSAYRQSADKALAGPFRRHLGRSYIRLKAPNGRADGG